jgi:tetratricopeptide (TPR) repeat protein
MVLICLLIAGAIVPAADPPPATGSCTEADGWCRYRNGSFAEAAAAFEEQLKRRPGDPDAVVGLGYARLQLGDVAAARSLFRSVLKRHAGNGDARRGLSLAALREPGEELRFREDVSPARPLAVPARALTDFLEIREPDGSYAPVFVKGVNLGAARPGSYPTEFPREVSVYLDWLDTIAGLGANTVRLYALLPPEFYQALATHNALSGTKKLWLIQGVWTELPEANEFLDGAYVRELEREIAAAIDAVHGDLVMPARPGHASGIYETDASGSLLALIVGREWEPFAVSGFNAKHPELTRWRGTYFAVEDARAMETWVARMCDFAAGYEARRYRMLHPLTFANWPTLDPLRHESESNREEEDAWKAKYGIPYFAILREPPWENDAVSLDATKIAATAAMPAGFFAAYHIYPNYPDFLNLETRFADYLADLKRYHGHQPVLVAEFGISTSRGVAHVHPEGWNHGGNDERGQGELVSSMFNTIHRTGYAGGIVFEFMDEWFKGTWSRTPLTIPAERRRLWFDAESPEQSYGLLANRPETPVRVDGDPSDWARIPAIFTKETRGARGWNAIRELHVTSDEGYLYVMVRTEGGPSGPDWASTSFRLAIDTYDAGRGVTRLPAPGEATIATGAEFLVDLGGPGDSFVTVAAPYEPYAAIDGGPVASPPSDRGGRADFVPLMFEANRERIGRDGTRYAAVTVDRGVLRYGSLDPGARDFDTRTDVAVGAAHGTIELRLPWGLLNVTDPSSRRVLHQETAHEPPLDSVVTEGFRIYAFAADPSRPKRAPVSRLPAAGATAPFYSWAPWDVPKSHMEPKAGVAQIRAALRALPDRVAPSDPARAR